MRYSGLPARAFKLSVRLLLGTSAAIILAVAACGAAEPDVSSQALVNIDAEGRLRDSRDGKVYDTVKIGNQRWMSENLAYHVAGSWCYGDDEDNCRLLGRLYTWDMLPEACPPGWHVPTDSEWKTLEREIGLPASIVDQDGWRGTNEGSKLKESGSSGFNAKIGGYRTKDGRYVNFRNDADFWTATETNQHEAWRRALDSFQDTIGRNEFEKRHALYVRCVQKN